MHYNDKSYNLENFQVDIIEKNYDDSLAGHIRIKKTLELLLHKYYWSKNKVNIENCIQSHDIYIKNKAQRYKLYHNIHLLSIFIHE